MIICVRARNTSWHCDFVYRVKAGSPFYPAQCTKSGLAELEAVGGASCQFKLKLAMEKARKRGRIR
jgi:hypothetical protein